jgi:hypothetical protein
MDCASPNNEDTSPTQEEIFKSGSSGSVCGALKRPLLETAAIRERLGWKRSLSGEEVLLKSCKDYPQTRREISIRKDWSAHRESTPIGETRMLKWLY